MSVAYQSWEVGTGPKAYQRVMDASPYKWQHQQQLEPGKANVSALSMAKLSSDETAETGKACIVPAIMSPVIQSVLRYGECGPVSPFVLPPSAYPGGELEIINHTVASKGVGRGNISQRSLRYGCSFEPKKIHPHEPELNSLDEATPTIPMGLATECLALQTTKGGLTTPAFSSSSSSIGAANSLSSDTALGGVDNSDDQEVESARRGPLNLTTLEESLPIRRGLSRYYAGQSKSFGCLADAVNSSTLGKPANPYATKRRRGLSIYDDRHRSFPPISRSSASGISKRNSFGSSRNLALAMAMESTQEEDEDDNDEEHDDVHSPLPRVLRGRENGGENAGLPRALSARDVRDAARHPKRVFSFADIHDAAIE